MKETFYIVPGNSGPLWLFAVIALFFGALLAFFASFVYSSRYLRYEVSAEGLAIRGDIYGRSIPRKALQLDRAKAVDLTQVRDLQLSSRTNGAGLPGYGAGWFRLRNGEKALAFVTDRRHVLYVPTNAGYSVLLSVKNPEALLAALRR
jgi:hypothetical protein